MATYRMYGRGTGDTSPQNDRFKKMDSCSKTTVTTCDFPGNWNKDIWASKPPMISVPLCSLRPEARASASSSKSVSSFKAGNQLKQTRARSTSASSRRKRSTVGPEGTILSIE